MPAKTKKNTKAFTALTENKQLHSHFVALTKLNGTTMQDEIISFVEKYVAENSRKLQKVG